MQNPVSQEIASGLKHEIAGTLSLRKECLPYLTAEEIKILNKLAESSSAIEEIFAMQSSQRGDLTTNGVLLPQKILISESKELIDLENGLSKKGATLIKGVIAAFGSYVSQYSPLSEAPQMNLKEILSVIERGGDMRIALDDKRRIVAGSLENTEAVKVGSREIGKATLLHTWTHEHAQILTAESYSFREHFQMPITKVGVIGAGLSGQTAAKLLVQNGGQQVSIFEGRDRLGGRAFTGEMGEKGGELIDELYTEFKAQCEEEGVKLRDNYHPGQTHCNFAFNVEGEHVSREKLSEALVPFVEKLNQEMELMASGTPEGDALRKRLSNMLASDYFREIPTLPEWAVKTLEAHLGGEWGPADTQAATIFIENMGYEEFTPENPNLGSPGFARYTVEGGVTTLVNKLAESILRPDNGQGSAEYKMNHKLTAIRKVDTGWECDFNVQGEKSTEKFDYLVVTIPLHLLKNVDLSGAGLSQERLNAIEAVEFGTDGKVHIVSKNSYNPDSLASTTFTDEFLGQATDGWRATRKEDPSDRDKEVVRTMYLSEADVAEENAGSKSALINATRKEFDRMFKDGDHTGKAELVTWHDGENAAFSGGAYASWGPGVMEEHADGLLYRFAGDRAGITFAGDTLDMEFNGYMEGAVRQGINAARYIIEDVVRTRTDWEIPLNASQTTNPVYVRQTKEESN